MTDQALAILNNNILGTLATVNSDGSPWATPLHFVNDGTAMYWFSAEDRVHSQNILRDPRVSVAVFSPDESQGPTGVYVNGIAHLLDEAERSAALELVRKRLGTVPPVFEKAGAYRLPIGTYNEEKSTGKCWYFYS